MEDEPEILTLADGKVSLWRNVKFMNGTQEIGRADHMIVEHSYPPGPDEDVVIVQEGGKPRVKRLQPQIEITTTSPAIPATSRGGFSLADVGANDEKRLLALYRMFSSKPV